MSHVRPTFHPTAALRLIALALMTLSWATPACAAGFLAHDLSVRLDPAAQRLDGVDRIIVTDPPERLHLLIAPQAIIKTITVDDRKVTWQLKNGHLAVPLPLSRGQSIRPTIAITYSAAFNDAPPQAPANTDNPGFGVRGTISEKGTVLLAGTGWYPRAEGVERSIRLTVTAPAGTLAVTSGRLEGHTTTGDGSHSRWQISRPTGALSLCAGPYVMRQKQQGPHMARTYFTTPNAHLADPYLDASLSYLTQYSERFGPYPFDHFAVVENHYPTGYGFPGFTLIGGRVLQLPFIIPTSLRHEIAHCWWGNGVTVEASQGNWCEGLATYVADYAYRSEQGASAATDYRRQLLRNYTSLVAPGEAIPLNRFLARRDRVTKATGYDKGALVFHMLHRRLGDGFWTALAELFRERCFSAVSWEDLQTYFQRHADSGLDSFFDQWLGRSDAPRLRLEGVSYDAESGRLEGRIVQSKPAYDLSVEVHAGGGGKQTSRRIALRGTATTFGFPLPQPPQWVEVDPEAHLFRRLWPAEIPATINSLKGAGQVVVVTTPEAEAQTHKLAALLPKALGLTRQPHDGTPAKATLWVGNAKPEGLPTGIRIDGRRLFLNGEAVSHKADTFFAVWRSEDAGLRALYWSPTLAEAQRVARKIPHYGKYSYLGFDQATNIIKATWPVTDSPLRVTWPMAHGEVQ